MSKERSGGEVNMGNAFEWMKSTRSIAVILVFVLLFTALVLKLLDGKDIIAVSTLVLGAYFGKRDSQEDRMGEDTKIESSTTITSSTPTKE